MTGCIHGALVLLALLPAAAPATVPPPATLTTLEAAGRSVYEEGVSPSGGEITARLGGSDVPGAALPCSGCHGLDGLGRPDGVSGPADIRWSALVRGDGHQHPKRRHGPFDETTLGRAIEHGFDPANNELDPSMPRYRLPREDLRALLAYLRVLEQQPAPGVTPERVRIGTVLPLSGPLVELGTAVRRMIEVAFDDINRGGGIRGRRFELVVADYGEGPESAYAAVWPLLRDRQVLLLLAPFSMGWEARLASLAQEQRTPVIAPFSIAPDELRASGPLVYHLLSGAAELAQLLARHAGEGARTQPAALLHAEGDTALPLVEDVRGRLVADGWAGVSMHTWPADAARAAELVGRLKDAGVASVFVLGSDVDVIALASGADRIGWRPRLLLPAPFAPTDVKALPPVVATRTFIAYPSTQQDHRAEALRRYSTLIARAGVRPLPAYQLPVYAAALVLAEALRQAGDAPTRQGVADRLDGLADFATGLVPPLTFAGARVGAAGGHVLAPDRASGSLRPVTGFTRLPASSGE